MDNDSTEIRSTTLRGAFAVAEAIHTVMSLVLTGKALIDYIDGFGWTEFASFTDEVNTLGISGQDEHIRLLFLLKIQPKVKSTLIDGVTEACNKYLTR